MRFTCKCLAEILGLALTCGGLLGVLLLAAAAFDLLH